MTSTCNVNTSSQNSIIKINESEPKKPHQCCSLGGDDAVVILFYGCYKCYTSPAVCNTAWEENSPVPVPLPLWSWQSHGCSPDTPSSRSRWLYSEGTLGWRWRLCLHSCAVPLRAYSVLQHFNTFKCAFTCPFKCAFILADVRKRFVFYKHESQRDAESTHSDVVGVDVIWTRKIWICFHDFNPRRVNCKHNSRCD